jgi:hypothetical protein
MWTRRAATSISCTRTRALEVSGTARTAHPARWEADNTSYRVHAGQFVHADAVLADGAHSGRNLVDGADKPDATEPSLARLRRVHCRHPYLCSAVLTSSSVSHGAGRSDRTFLSKSHEREKRWLPEYTSTRCELRSPCDVVRVGRDAKANNASVLLAGGQVLQQQWVHHSAVQHTSKQAGSEHAPAGTWSRCRAPL